MTDEEIINGLELCKKDKCVDCPFAKTNACVTVMATNALDLINRQQAEIERLKKIGTEADNFARAICNERMLKGKPVADYEDLQEYIKKAKAEAIKEFAERLKPMYKILCVDEGDWCYELDRLVKEMVEERRQRNESKN